jgi:histidine triad (HIT) family protein
MDRLMDCVFCQIVAGEAPALIIREWPDALAIIPLNPVVEGHLLILPKAHVLHFADDPVVTGVVMARAAELAGKRRGYGQANLITSMGDAATQTVLHLHVHVIPREDGDNVSLPWDVRGV